ncbi:hypothetical protein KRR38_23090 [Novosphingobium sp. G106]|uniref:hypothetical protein n=1 Tax=Novosphingobium sp. G106 TaxID=2849500 RepID=UPI001C2CEC2C|nr:hypothetical protein [Novosphingobium sp. G106]MBV1690477.1 hypothetical protein [Novosphingobium sp. G106]MBV1690486.1 hypothetical protein [Novosphingobium sp. G106]
MREPSPTEAQPRLMVITDTVALTIRVEDHEPIKIEVCRLARDPHWAIRMIDPSDMTARVVRTDEIEEGYAEFDIMLPSQIVRPTVAR